MCDTDQTRQLIDTDAGLAKNSRAFCDQIGNVLFSSSQSSKEHIFVTRKTYPT